MKARLLLSWWLLMNNTLISDYFRRFQYIQFQERINNLDFPIELRYNHNHDQKGRFCSGGGGGRMSASEKSTDTQNDLTSTQNSGNINLVNNYHSGIFGDLKNKLKNIFTNKSYLPVAEEYFNDLPQKTSVYSSYEDMKATNPHYNDSYNYQINCQRCVPAYEMRRRGYNVTAKPAPDDDILGLIFEKIFVDMKWQTCSNGSGMDDIKEYMKKCGDGSRAEISLQTYEGAHLFMAEQHNGSRKQKLKLILYR